MTLEAPSGPPIDPARAASLLERLLDAVGAVVLGTPETLRLAVVAILAEGHVLLEDAPGTGKTTLARSLAGALGLDFGRVQFTADMLPADVTGLALPEAGGGPLRFQPGPIFRHLVLADELNRTPPRTQSALLEAMNEGSVTVDGQTHTLPRPFFVIATQNPLEFAGTYPLPESQLDRFLIRLELGYPSLQAEAKILRERRRGEPADPNSVLTPEELQGLIAAAKEVRLHESVLEYLLRIVHATRRQESLELGASTRGALALQRATQALALLEGRDYVVPDDVQRLVVPVLAHRLVPSGAHLESAIEASTQALRSILEAEPVPQP